MRTRAFTSSQNYINRAFQAKECQNHLESAILPKLPVEILTGKKNLEVRPTFINKVKI